MGLRQAWRAGSRVNVTGGDEVNSRLSMMQKSGVGQRVPGHGMETETLAASIRLAVRVSCGRMTALVLDADNRSALAAVRSLGAQGVTVYTADAGAESLAGHSRFSSGYFRLPSPLEAPDTYPGAVRELAQRIGAEVVFPMVDASVMLLAPKDDPRQAQAPGHGGDPQQSHATIPAGGLVMATPTGSAYLALSDKGRLVELAGQVGIPTPRTITVRDAASLRAAVGEIGLPCVLKPARSRLLLGGKIIGTSVTVAQDMTAVERVASQPWLGATECLVQEFIPGTGAGVFSLCGPAGPVAWFAHRRLREKPPRGGVSVLSQSAPVDPALQALAYKLLRSVNWFGPAMIEFRVDPEGRPWLMEVNGRFWGSLQLAIDSGVDFPWLLYRLCHGETVEGPEDYEVGRRLRWLLGDLDHLLLQLRGKGTANSAGEKLNALGRFLGPQGKKTRLEVLRRGDRGPFRNELAMWLSALRK